MEIFGGHIGWPEGLFSFWLFIVILTHAVKDGEKIEGPNSAYNGSMAIIRGIIVFGLLIWGGFYA